MSTLQLSIHGPFLYRFTGGQVELHAAKCAGHTAGFFTAKRSPFNGTAPSRELAVLPDYGSRLHTTESPIASPLS